MVEMVLSMVQVVLSMVQVALSMLEGGTATTLTAENIKSVAANSIELAPIPISSAVTSISLEEYC